MGGSLHLAAPPSHPHIPMSPPPIPTTLYPPYPHKRTRRAHPIPTTTPPPHEQLWRGGSHTPLRPLPHIPPHLFNVQEIFGLEVNCCPL